jgi:hypothetical protein
LTKKKEEEEEDEEANDDISLCDTGAIIQRTTNSLKDTIPDSFSNRNVVSCNVRNGPTNLGDVSQFFTRWSTIAKDPITFMKNLCLMWGTGNNKPPHHVPCPPLRGKRRPRPGLFQPQVAHSVTFWRIFYAVSTATQAS